MLRRVVGVAGALALLLVWVAPAGAASAANRCVVLKAANGRFMAASSQTRYRAIARRAADAAAFSLKPTGLGTMLLSDRDGRLLSRPASALTAARTSTPSARSEFSQALITHRYRLLRATRCIPFPEAQVDATGTTFAGRVFGFADAHLHITAFMRAGGRVISGEPFDRFGIAAALGRDASVHGRNGQLDYTGSLLRTASPVGTHDTHGWPTFTGWPTYNTQTHQQTYWVWLQRAWEAGERLVVAQTVDDEPLCRIEPQRLYACAETSSIEAQIRFLRRMQDYVDAQYGGAGRGWFRLVYSPAQARRVITAGKLAVIIGIESSDLFGCSERAGKPGCTRAGIDRALRRYAQLGVRGMFIGHWINNALTGTALEGGAKGIFINLLNRIGTGSYFTTTRCPAAGQGEAVLTLPASVLVSLTRFFRVARSVVSAGMPAYPSGPQCNAEGLTPLGDYLIHRMMAAHMLIEADHLSEQARDTVLSIAEHAHYPLVSSHNGTGGTWTTAELRRLYDTGGFVAVTPADGPDLAAKINRMETVARFSGIGIGTDTGGFASLPGPRPDATTHPLRYPFRSYDGRVTFGRERTGSRVFDLNRDGVAHYGLIPDLLADTEASSGGRRALSLLFNSAEAYLEMWARAERRSP